MWEMWTGCEDSTSFAPFDQDLLGLTYPADLDDASFDFNLSITAATGSSESSRDDRDVDDEEYLDIIGIASNELDLDSLDVSSLIESLSGETLLSSSLLGTSPVTGSNGISNSMNMSMSANSSVANVECSKFMSTSPSSHGSSMVKFASATGTMDCSLGALRANSHSTPFSTNGNSKDCSTSLLGKTILGKRRKVSQHPSMNKKKKKKNKCIRGGISLLARPSPVPSAIVQQRSQRERDNGRDTNLRGKGDSNQLICSRDSNNNSTLVVSSSITCTSSSNTKCQISSSLSGSAVSSVSSPNRSNYSKFSSTPFTLSNSNRDHDYWH